MNIDLIIKNGKVFTNDTLIEADVLIKNGKIWAIVEDSDALEIKAKKIIEADDLYVLPGSVDTHVHIRDPGRSDRETFETGTKCAAAGGVTTFFEHPISSPPQYSPEILRNRIEVAKPQCFVDYAFFGAAGAEFPEEITKIAKEGIVGYKTFLHKAQAGREKEFVGLTMANDGEMIKGFTEVAKTNLICTV
ncbi:MAG: amidohydrolase family protein, partial [Tissierellia bacterium]|nr:amidohydrolase family protein [Tissierellia bacterium]